MKFNIKWKTIKKKGMEVEKVRKWNIIHLGDIKNCITDG